MISPDNPAAGKPEAIHRFEWECCVPIPITSEEKQKYSFYLQNPAISRQGTRELTIGANSQGEPEVVLGKLNVGNYIVIREEKSPEKGREKKEIWKRIYVEPQKIDSKGLVSMLGDIQYELPLAIAARLNSLPGAAVARSLGGFGLAPAKSRDSKRSGASDSEQSQGAFAGELQWGRLDNLLRHELDFLKRFLKGGETQDNPGFLKILDNLRNRYLRNLRAEIVNLPAYRARRPDAASLRRAFRSGNVDVDADGVVSFRRLDDRRPRLDPDIHENRLIDYIYRLLEARLCLLLRNVSAILSLVGADSDSQKLAKELQAKAGTLRQELARMRARASFLEEVGALKSFPPKITIAILKNPLYKSAFEILTALNSHIQFSLKGEQLDFLLDNTPMLYQKWCSLLVADELLSCLQQKLSEADAAFRIQELEHCFKRDAEGLFIDLLDQNNTLLTLKLAMRERRLALKLILERDCCGKIRESAHAVQSSSQTSDGFTFRSLSFNKRPDIWIEALEKGGEPRLLLLDPKYKDYPKEDIVPRTSSVYVSDIDKMHTYCDAIVAQGAESEFKCVAFAAILHIGNKNADNCIGEARYFPFGRSVATQFNAPLQGVGSVLCRAEPGREGRQYIREIISAFLESILKDSEHAANSP